MASWYGSSTQFKFCNSSNRLQTSMSLVFLHLFLLFIIVSCLQEVVTVLIICFWNVLSNQPLFSKADTIHKGRPIIWSLSLILARTMLDDLQTPWQSLFVYLLQCMILLIILYNICGFITYQKKICGFIEIFLLPSFRNLFPLDLRCIECCYVL